MTTSTSTSTAPTRDSADRLRVGVIGYGAWGRVHLEAYRRNARAGLVAICGRDPRRTADVAKIYGARAYTDVGAMLGEMRLDLVSVVLPDEAHFAPTLQVLRAGVHCFAEKPLAMDREEAIQLLEAARQSGVRFGVNFNHRYATPFQKAGKLIDAGTLGAPAHLLWKFTGGHFPERQPALHHLLYMQSHGFDMLRWLGGPIRDVGCVATDPRGNGSLTTATVSLTFESGAVGTLIASVDGNYADTHVHEFECIGLNGRIRVTDALRRFEWAPRGERGESGTVQVWEPGFFDDAERDFTATTARHIDLFIAAQLGNLPVPVPAEDGYYALLAGLAAIEAAHSGQRVALPSR